MQLYLIFTTESLRTEGARLTVICIYVLGSINASYVFIQLHIAALSGTTDHTQCIVQRNVTKSIAAVFPAQIWQHIQEHVRGQISSR
jgi:hypothetical protein